MQHTMKTFSEFQIRTHMQARKHTHTHTGELLRWFSTVQNIKYLSCNTQVTVKYVSYRTICTVCWKKEAIKNITKNITNNGTSSNTQISFIFQVMLRAILRLHQHYEFTLDIMLQVCKKATESNKKNTKKRPINQIYIQSF